APGPRLAMGMAAFDPVAFHSASQYDSANRMNKIASILRLDFLPASTDVALLVLRLWLGLSLLVLHGWMKLSTFQQMSRKFPDPFGVGSEVSLGLAVFGEVLCSIFLVIGFFTRFAALGAAIT